MTNSGYVVSTDSDWVQQEVGDVSADCDDLGIDLGGNGPGVYLWEGTLRGVGSMDDGYETVYSGSLREVEPGELLDLVAMSPPEELEVVE